MIKKGRWLSRVICMAILLVFLCGQVASAITIREENEVAGEFIRMIRAHYRIIDDPVVNDYIVGLGERILSAFPEQPFNYHFYVVESDVFNAFAGPGGHVFIHSGLLQALPNEEALAGIMAHEISHVYSRHISDRIERSKKIGMGTLAGVAAGILVGVAGGNPSAGGALTMGTLAGSQSAALAYSREDEMQADQVGMSYMMAAGYGGEEMLTGLKTIREKQWFGPSQIPTYLTTHPALEDRIAYIGNWIEAHKEEIAARRKSIDQASFLKTKARLTALYTPVALAEDLFTHAMERGAAPLYTEYGLGLLMDRMGKYDKAALHMRKVLERRAFDKDALRGLGRIYFHQGKYKEARQLLEGAMSLDPDDFESNLWLGRLLIEEGAFHEAVNRLVPLATDYGPGALAHYDLGNAFAKLGKVYDSSYHLGFYYRGVGDLRNAVFQLKRAKEMAPNEALRKAAEKILAEIVGKNGKKKKKKKPEEPAPGEEVDGE
ncbi:M48 family metallopeptidase [Desulfoluna sp.]|uniref:M48 family metallopeptidase n=1 Tax=Desulfoluna sp. TaxID=2045199 RepID=UPI00262E27DF|nr:M48 family metallopeptidase [Desulfoluna sp.]